MIDFKIPVPGAPAPGFCLRNTSGSETRLEDYRGTSTPRTTRPAAPSRPRSSPL